LPAKEDDMSTFESFYKDHGEVERCSHRIQNGVEIFEREIHKIAAAESVEDIAIAAQPRLVVSDTVSTATRAFISRTRSEIAGLNAFLQGLSTVETKTR
jgi:hypothetical protein